MAIGALRYLTEAQVAAYHRDGYLAVPELIDRARLVHGSAANTSPTERRLLINSYSAADAIPLVPDSSHSALYGQIVRGQPARVARREAGELRMPPDWSGGYTSIYALQERAARS